MRTLLAAPHWVACQSAAVGGGGASGQGESAFSVTALGQRVLSVGAAAWQPLAPSPGGVLVKGALSRHQARHTTPFYSTAPTPRGPVPRKPGRGGEQSCSPSLWGRGAWGIRGAESGPGGPGGPEPSGLQHPAESALHGPRAPGRGGQAAPVHSPDVHLSGPMPGSEHCPPPHCPEPQSDLCRAGRHRCRPYISDEKTEHPGPSEPGLDCPLNPCCPGLSSGVPHGPVRGRRSVPGAPRRPLPSPRPRSRPRPGAVRAAGPAAYLPPVTPAAGSSSVCG